MHELASESFFSLLFFFIIGVITGPVSDTNLMEFDSSQTGGQSQGAHGKSLPLHTLMTCLMGFIHF